MNWVEYTQAAQRLADARRREARRQAEVRDRTAGLRGAADQLRQRLDRQRERLIDVAGRLGQSPPAIAGVSRAGLTDAAEAVRRAWAAVEQADVAARQAEERGYEPAWLPGVAPAVRNSLIYAGTTAAAALVSCGLTLFGTKGPDHRIPLWAAPWSLCGLPAVAFFAGYVLIGAFARPRIDPGSSATRSVRLGGLICVLGLWLVWAIGVTVNLTG